MDEDPPYDYIQTPDEDPIMWGWVPPFGIISEEAGGIIAYANSREFAEEIVRRLNIAAQVEKVFAKSV